MSANRWSATLAGAARLTRKGVYRGHCRCAHGTCRRCLVRLGLVASTEAERQRTARTIAHAERRLDAAIDRAATAHVAGDQRASDCARAEAEVELAGLAELGVKR